MFGDFLLEQEIEASLPLSLEGAVSFLEEAVGEMAVEGHRFRLRVLSGRLGSAWRVAVDALDGETGEAVFSPLAFLKMEAGEGSTCLRIPPRERWIQEMSDRQVRLFTGFVFALLECLARRGYIDLPGV